MDIRPNHTIYINHLNEKVKKEGKKFSKFSFYYSEIQWLLW